MKEEKLRLDLDALAEEGYLYSATYDLYGAGHSITILAKDREAFLDEYATKFRELVDKSLEVYVEEDEEEE